MALGDCLPSNVFVFLRVIFLFSCEQDRDTDGDGLLNGQGDPDIDGDGLINQNDDDIDGDGIKNEEDEDMDGECLE